MDEMLLAYLPAKIMKRRSESPCYDSQGEQIGIEINTVLFSSHTSTTHGKDKLSKHLREHKAGTSYIIMAQRNFIWGVADSPRKHFQPHLSVARLSEFPVQSPHYHIFGYYAPNPPLR